jgi:hypothetical protein
MADVNVYYTKGNEDNYNDSLVDVLSVITDLHNDKKVKQLKVIIEYN